jgi:hypothetical protein
METVNAISRLPCGPTSIPDLEAVKDMENLTPAARNEYR